MFLLWQIAMARDMGVQVFKLSLATLAVVSSFTAPGAPAPAPRSLVRRHMDLDTVRLVGDGAKSAQNTLETRRAALALAAAALPLPSLAAAPAGFVGGRSATAKAAPAFIERGLTFKNGRTMVITQAFGAARGSAKDDADAGDRTGTYAWPGGVALARYLVGAPATVRGRRVLELGCGTGAAGIMAKWLGARKVLLTDGSPAVLKNTEINVKRNARGGTAVSRLRWGYGDDIARAGRKQWDLVIAAEVGYQRETLPALLDTIAALLADDGRALLQLTPELADNGRGLEGVKEFINKSSLVLLDVALPDDDDDEAEDDGTARFTLGLRPGAS